MTNFSRALSALLLTLILAAVPAWADHLTCDFDEDGTVDTVTKDGKRALVVLSNDGTPKNKTVKIGRTYQESQLQCGKANKVNQLVLKKGGNTYRYTVVGGGGGGNGLNAVCKQVRELQRCEIWKSIASTHITDARKNSTSFITNRGCPGGFSGCIPVYDSNGTQVHSMGEYQPTGSFYDNRHYGCFGCGDCDRATTVATQARNNTGQEDVYLKDASGNCVHIPDPGRCYNSSGC